MALQPRAPAALFPTTSSTRCRGGDRRRPGPGEPLPSERRLAEVLGVSRPAVREALQRFAHARAGRRAPGRLDDGARLPPPRRPGPAPPAAGAPAVSSTWRSPAVVLEARLHVGPKIAELAAARSGPAIADGLRATPTRSPPTTDGVRRQQHALTYWDQVVAGADSITFRLMFNSMRAAYEPVLDALAVVMSAEVDRVEAYDALTDAIEAGDGDRCPRARSRPARGRDHEPDRRHRRPGAVMTDIEHSRAAAGGRRRGRAATYDEAGHPGRAFRAFWRYPSPWLIATALVADAGRPGRRRRLAARRPLGPVSWSRCSRCSSGWCTCSCCTGGRATSPASPSTRCSPASTAAPADPRDVPLVFIPWRRWCG